MYSAKIPLFLALAGGIVVLIFFISSYVRKRGLIKSEKRHLSDILYLVGDPSANVFKIPKEKALANANSLTMINRFNDYIFLTDFDCFTSSMPKDLNKAWLISWDLSEKLVDHKISVSSYSHCLVLLENIKLNHMLNPAYKGLSKDYSPWQKPLNKHPQLPADWDSVRNKVMKRDGYKCVLCNSEGKELQVHHIRYRSHGGSDGMENLASLCMECHGTLPYHLESIFGLNSNSLEAALMAKDGVLPFWAKKSLERARLNERKKEQDRKIIMNICRTNPALVRDLLIDGNPLLNSLINDDFIRNFKLDESAIIDKLGNLDYPGLLYPP
jgi:hypothetical protein